MVLIIRNNRIQSRRHYRIKHLWSCVVDNNRQNSVEFVQKNDIDNTMVNALNKDVRSENKRQVKVLGILFLYSVAMFTLPFAAFFATQYIMTTEFKADRFTNSCFSTLAAVITVNLIIWSYAYRAFFNPDDPVENIENDPVEDHSTKSRNDLNLKED